MIYSYVDEKGVVTRIADGTVEVTLTPGDACTKCEARDFCRPSEGTCVIVAINPGGVEVGDEVLVTVVRQNSMLAVFVFFGLPVVLSLIGLLLGHRYGEIGLVITGSGGFIVGLVIAKIINDILSKKLGFFPKITEIIKKTQP
jgi:positive regulator of sigma E activity